MAANGRPVGIIINVHTNRREREKKTTTESHVFILYHGKLTALTCGCADCLTVHNSPGLLTCALLTCTSDMLHRAEHLLMPESTECNMSYEVVHRKWLNDLP